MTPRAALLRVLVVLVALVAASTACTRDRDTAPDTSTTTTTTAAAKQGGTVRVAVWAAPDPAAPTLGGAAVRALVLPQLFVAEPDGRWSPSLVAPGTDRMAPDARSASFRLREGAAWSDGTPITAEDLRRTADARFVAGVDGPVADTITVRFTSALPGWRRLWSGVDSVAAARDGVWGGPFVVASVTPGLETVLRANPGWKGGGPHLDEVRFVLVPDVATARQLLARGEVDVVAPPAETNRTGKLARIDGVAQRSASAPGGWWVGLLLNGDRLGADDRRAIAAAVDRQRFVSTLLDREAEVLDGFAGAEDATWSPVSKGDTSALRGDVVDMVAVLEEPMSALLHRSMQKAVRAGAGGDTRLELRAAEADRVEGWVSRREFGAALVLAWDGPSVCWTCRWSSVDAALALAADSGDAAAATALEAKLRDDALVLPLWRPRAVVAWRTSVLASQLRANPYGLSAAWDAWRWSRR